MNRETARSLLDVHDLCSEIEELTRSVSLEEFSGNRLLYLSIERLFEIAGEAFNRDRRFDPSLDEAVPNARSLVGMRNRIAHDYDNIRLDIVWETATQDIPLIRLEIETILLQSDYLDSNP